MTRGSFPFFTIRKSMVPQRLFFNLTDLTECILLFDTEWKQILVKR